MDIPTLPDIGLKEENAKINPWLETYIEYATARSPMTPRLFHESAGLWLLSTLVARRTILRMDFDDIFPNLFIAWIAGTTVWNKTTAMKVAQRIIIQNFPYLLIAHSTTPEALISDLSGSEPAKFDNLSEDDKQLWFRKRDYAAQKGMMVDEMSSIMSMGKRDVYAEIPNIMLQLYDCTELYERSTKKQGITFVRDSYLTFLGASTPAAMSEYLISDKVWNDGWWARFAVICPEEEFPEEKEGESETIGEPPRQPPILVKKMVEINNRLPTWSWGQPHTTTECAWTGQAAFALWKKYYKTLRELLHPSYGVDAKLHGTYGRLSTHALKVAMLLALLDWNGSGNIPINLSHITKAILITESWRASAHRVLTLADMSEDSKLEKKLVTFLSRNLETGYTVAQAHRAMPNVPYKTLEQEFTFMTKMNIVAMEYHPTTAKGGQPTYYFRLVT